MSIPSISSALNRSYNRNTLIKGINSYLPDRRKKGGEAVDDLIKYLADDLLAQLDELEKETNFEFLTSLDDEEIRNEAQLLFEELNRLKSRLQEL
ncbi:hypothetical protein [Syntrophomonas curvata]